VDAIAAGPSSFLQRQSLGVILGNCWPAQSSSELVMRSINAHLVTVAGFSLSAGSLTNKLGLAPSLIKSAKTRS
jgi:hypothetical protein